MSCKWIENYKYFETEQSKQHSNEYEFEKDIYEIYTKNRKVIACLSLNCIQKIKNINFYRYRNKKNGFDEKLIVLEVQVKCMVFFFFLSRKQLIR